MIVVLNIVSLSKGLLLSRRRPSGRDQVSKDIAVFPGRFSRNLLGRDSQIDSEVHLRTESSFVQFWFRGATMPAYVHRGELGALALAAGGSLCTRGMGQVAWESFRPP